MIGTRIFIGKLWQPARGDPDGRDNLTRAGLVRWIEYPRGLEDYRRPSKTRASSRMKTRKKLAFYD